VACHATPLSTERRNRERERDAGKKKKTEREREREREGDVLSASFSHSPLRKPKDCGYARARVAGPETRPKRRRVEPSGSKGDDGKIGGGLALCRAPCESRASDERRDRLFGIYSSALGVTMIA